MRESTTARLALEKGTSRPHTTRRRGIHIASTCPRRIIPAAPILLLPPLVISRIEQHSTVFTRPKTQWVRVPLLLALVGLAFRFRLPLTFGLFRQTAQLDTKYLEPELQHAKQKQQGQPKLSLNGRQHFNEYPDLTASTRLVLIPKIILMMGIGFQGGCGIHKENQPVSPLHGRSG
ncbi:hypothetical protein PsorP6_017776 [Peronosclerospora sorghi]|uniref:Uncharacterized protein n=1 Tax=Peronosclerospora sorghi TaxID=230839 RepID=A0ACC0WLK0_9STRA|nr:hypothetical protein PsorP6_017776 [Peronosclerospora sorghi]